MALSSTYQSTGLPLLSTLYEPPPKHLISVLGLGPRRHARPPHRPQGPHAVRPPRSQRGHPGPPALDRARTMGWLRRRRWAEPGRRAATMGSRVGARRRRPPPPLRPCPACGPVGPCRRAGNAARKPAATLPRRPTLAAPSGALPHTPGPGPGCPSLRPGRQWGAAHHRAARGARAKSGARRRTAGGARSPQGDGRCAGWRRGRPAQGGGSRWRCGGASVSAGPRQRWRWAIPQGAGTLATPRRSAPTDRTRTRKPWHSPSHRGCTRGMLPAVDRPPNTPQPTGTRPSGAVSPSARHGVSAGEAWYSS